jgi:hypothetical protein
LELFVIDVRLSWQSDDEPTNQQEVPSKLFSAILSGLRVRAWCAVKGQEGRPSGLQGRNGVHKLHRLIAVWTK